MSKPVAVRFSENLDDFFEYLITLVTSIQDPSKFGTAEPIEALRKVMKMYEIGNIMHIFTVTTHMHWAKVKSRDTSFFECTCTLIENMVNFIPIKDLRPTLFLDIASAKQMTSGGEEAYIVPREAVDVLWQYWDAFVIILIDYVHTMRKPRTEIRENGARRAIYTAHYLPDFDIRAACRTWMVDLRF